MEQDEAKRSAYYTGGVSGVHVGRDQFGSFLWPFLFVLDPAFHTKKNKKNQTSKKIKNISCPNDFVAPSSASCSSSFFFFPMFAALDRFLFPSRESSGSYLQWYTYVLTVCLLSELCWNISNSQCTYTFIRSGQKGSHVRARRIWPGFISGEWSLFPPASLHYTLSVFPNWQL